MNASQKELIYWCSYYRGLFMGDEDSYPPKRYLDNDYALDRWVEVGKHRQKVRSKTSMSPASDSNVVFNVGG